MRISPPAMTDITASDLQVGDTFIGQNGEQTTLFATHRKAPTKASLSITLKLTVLVITIPIPAENVCFYDSGMIWHFSVRNVRNNARNFFQICEKVLACGDKFMVGGVTLVV